MAAKQMNEDFGVVVRVKKLQKGDLPGGAGGYRFTTHHLPTTISPGLVTSFPK